MTLRLITLVLVLATGISSTACADATVSYSGTVYEYIYSPVPYPHAFVIAGTFAPGFDYTLYTCVYGIDEVCNMNGNGFQRAVSDGNLFPIGAGTLTDANGEFSGSGMTSAAPGTPIFLFAFDGPDSSGWIQSVAFASGTDPSFFVPAAGGSTHLDASLASLSILGGSSVFDGFDGLVLSGGLPMPEPTSVVLGLFFTPLLFSFRRHR